MFVDLFVLEFSNHLQGKNVQTWLQEEATIQQICFPIFILDIQYLCIYPKVSSSTKQIFIKFERVIKLRVGTITRKLQKTKKN